MNTFHSNSLEQVYANVEHSVPHYLPDDVEDSNLIRSDANAFTLAFFRGATHAGLKLSTDTRFLPFNIDTLVPLYCVRLAYLERYTGKHSWKGMFSEALQGTPYDEDLIRKTIESLVLGPLIDSDTLTSFTTDVQTYIRVVYNHYIAHKNTDDMYLTDLMLSVLGDFSKTSEQFISQTGLLPYTISNKELYTFWNLLPSYSRTIGFNESHADKYAMDIYGNVYYCSYNEAKNRINKGVLVGTVAVSNQTYQYHARRSALILNSDHDPRYKDIIPLESLVFLLDKEHYEAKELFEAYIESYPSSSSADPTLIYVNSVIEAITNHPINHKLTA